MRTVAVARTCRVALAIILLLVLGDAVAGCTVAQPTGAIRAETVPFTGFNWNCWPLRGASTPHVPLNVVSQSISNGILQRRFQFFLQAAPDVRSTVLSSMEAAHYRLRSSRTASPLRFASPRGRTITIAVRQFGSSTASVPVRGFIDVRIPLQELTRPPAAACASPGHPLGSRT